MYQNTRVFESLRKRESVSETQVKTVKVSSENYGVPNKPGSGLIALKNKIRSTKSFEINFYHTKFAK